MSREELLTRLGPKREGFKLDDKEATAQGLRDVTLQMKTEYQRLTQTGSLLEESSSTIDSVNNEYLNYRVSIKRAGAALSELKRRMESDDMYIWYSFCFFISVVAFIVSRRLGLLTVLSWVTNWVSYALSTIYSLTEPFLKTLSTTPLPSNTTSIIEEL